MIPQAAGAPLSALEDLSKLFRNWLQGDALLGAATSEMQEFLAGRARAPAPTGPAPIWRDDAWCRAFLIAAAEDDPDPATRSRRQQNVSLLRAAQADVVITGQQPGFLGGPLYTLFKAATAITAARMRSEAGHPTVPVFWMGDDDDDSREAFGPALFDPLRRALLRGQAPEGASDRMVGEAPARQWGRGEAAWLAEQTSRSPLAAELSALWAEGIAADWSWGRLHRRALLRVFAGADLLVVSGNDPRLHRAAAIFSGRLWQERELIRRLAEGRGLELAAAGYHAQIGSGSLERFFHVEEQGRRLSLAAADELPAPERLRPGVAVRSLLQDWLFQPAAVVVGPAELAYLKQLIPLYERLGVWRAPLLPRLFGQLVPAGAVVVAGAANGETAVQDAELAAARIIGTTARELAGTLQQVSQVPADKAAKLAEQRVAPWRKLIVRLILKEAERAAGPGAGLPDWVRPASGRQERSLASWWAVAMWGAPLLASVQEAAMAHLQDGAQERWLERILTVSAV